MKELELRVRRISGVRVYPTNDDDFEIAVALPDVVLVALIDDYELSSIGQLDAMKKYSKLFIALEQLQEVVEDIADELAGEVK